MAIVKKNRNEIFTQIASEFTNNTSISLDLFQSSPFGKLCQATSIAIESLYDTSEQNIIHALALHNYFGADLEEIASYIKITRKSASYAVGTIFAQDVLATLIPFDSQFSYGDILYKSTADREITSNSFSITSVSRAGTVATFIISSDHGLVSGATVTTSGTGVANFNKTATITLISSNSFSITVDDSGATSATGGTLTYLGASIPIISTTAGANTNINGSVNISSLSISLAICGTTVYGISGGADSESDDSLQARLEYRAHNYTNQDTKTGTPAYLTQKYNEITDVAIVEGYSSQIAITSIMKDAAYPDNLRKITFSQKHPFDNWAGMWFSEITGASASDLNVSNKPVLKSYSETEILIEADNDNTTDEDNTSANMQMTPYIYGESTIFLYKKNSVNKIFSNAELSAIKEDLTNNVMGFTSNRFYVSNFSKKSHTFTITGLTPNLTSLKTAITNNLIAWSKTLDPSVKTIYESQYYGVILASTDVNGNKVKTATISGNISLALNEILDVVSSDVVFA